MCSASSRSTYSTSSRRRQSPPCPASRSQLERKFRRLLGRTPQAEIRRVQIAKIRQLLLETDYPLKRIAELSGFVHVEYMCVVFKRLTGEAPGAFRRRHAASRATDVPAPSSSSAKE